MTIIELCEAADRATAAGDHKRAEDLMMGAPSHVTPKQLRELSIRLNLPEK